MIGDIILFPRDGIVSGILSWLLKLLNPSWNRKHWHVGIIVDKCSDGVVVFESLLTAVCKYHTWEELKNCAVYHIEPVTSEQVGRFLAEYKGSPYDVKGYIGTALAILMRHFFKFKFRIVDVWYYCWELARAWLEEINQCPVEDYEYLTIVDLAKKATPIKEH